MPCYALKWLNKQLKHSPENRTAQKTSEKVENVQTKTFRKLLEVLLKTPLKTLASYKQTMMFVSRLLHSIVFIKWGRLTLVILDDVISSSWYKNKKLYLSLWQWVKHRCVCKPVCLFPSLFAASCGWIYWVSVMAGDSQHMAVRMAVLDWLWSARQSQVREVKHNWISLLISE